MALRTTAWLLVWALFLAAGGCGDDGGTSADAGFRVGSDGGMTGCVDEDRDGYYARCNRRSKRDCDDNDRKITDECFRCAQGGPGCPCDRGAPPMDCKPPPIPVIGGYQVCNEGTMYCRDGKWTDCQAIGEYVFVPNK